MDKSRSITLEQELRESLVRQYGAVVGGADLSNVLGFKSADTLRKAVKNNTLPLTTFEIPGRKGRFAVTLEVANWLIALRNGGVTDPVVTPRSHTGGTPSGTENGMS